MSAFDELAALRSVVVLHAHPDDDTLSTGPLLAALSDAGVAVHLITATRGERGEVVPGSLPDGVSAEQLTDVREEEGAAAAEVLGLASRTFLGTPPARVAGLPARRYLDSGMRWVSEGVAGPAEDAEPDSLTSSPLADEAADLAAAVQHFEAQAVLSYDEFGGYQHPDHIRCHEIALAAAEATGVPGWAIASEAFIDPADAEWRDYPDAAARVLAALHCYRTQLSADQAGITHVGGQHQDLPLRVGLTRLG